MTDARFYVYAYYDRTDAAVVFRRSDAAGSRFIYHGNDGTHLPWNDTAQLDYLNPEVREAVIQEILGVARRFAGGRDDQTGGGEGEQRVLTPDASQSAYGQPELLGEARQVVSDCPGRGDAMVGEAQLHQLAQVPLHVLLDPHDHARLGDLQRRHVEDLPCADEQAPAVRVLDDVGHGHRAGLIAGLESQRVPLEAPVLDRKSVV